MLHFAIVQLSKRRYAVGEYYRGAKSNLQIYSGNELGMPNEMVEVVFEQALKFYCYKQTGNSLTDEPVGYLK